jgi:hypothetical protein
MFQEIKQFFKSKSAAVTAPVVNARPDLSALLSPGPAYVNPAAVAAPVVVPSVTDSVTHPVEITLPVATPALEIESTLDPDQRPIDPVEEASTSEPCRTPGRIRFLLKHEDEAATQRRISNDGQRHRNRMWHRES